MVDSEQLEREADELISPPKVDSETENTEVKDSEVPESQETQVQDTPPEQPDISVMAEQVKNAKARMTQATMEAAELRRQLQAKEEELSRLTAPKTDSPKTDEKKSDRTLRLKQVVQEFPDYSGPIVEELTEQEQRLKQLEEMVGNVAKTAQSTEQRFQENVDRSGRALHEAKIMKVHPDAFDIATQEDFHGWAERQPPMIRQAIQNGTADDVIHTLNLYKSSLKPSKSNERNEAARESAVPHLPKARSNKTNEQPRFTREQIKSMSQAEFEKNEAEIDKAMAAGLVQ